MKVIIAGSRDFNDYNLLCERMDFYLRDQEGVEIISGGARGADTLAIKYANERGIPVHVMNADWDKYGKSAGYKRNEQMAEAADALVAYWDGQSRGTSHMIDIAKKHGLKVRVVR